MTMLLVSWMNLNFKFYELWIVARLFQDVKVWTVWPCDLIQIEKDIWKKKWWPFEKKENDSAVHNSITYSWCLLHLLTVLVWELHWVLILLSSFQLHLSCHVWFNLFVFYSCLILVFVNHILDLLIRFLLCANLFLSLFLACLLWLFHWVCRSIFHLMFSTSSI